MNMVKGILASVALLVTSGVGMASSWHNEDVSVDIVSDHGYEFRQYDVDGGRHVNRAYLEAQKGENYSIRITNNSDERVGVVIAVDGRNIISGDKSYLKSHERMYVLRPYQSAEYSGWRTSKNRVNRFYFTDAGDSYAEAWRDRSAMGVIAVAVFKGRHHRVRNDYESRSKAKHAARKPGTGFGESEYSPTRMVYFKPRSHASEKHFVKYEWRKSLCEKGIVDCYVVGNRFWPEDDWDEGFARFPLVNNWD